MPVAVNCWLKPSATVGFEGVIETETRAAAASNIVAEPEIESKVAVIVELPESATAAAIPPPLAIVTAVVVPELQETLLVRSCVELSV